MKTVLYLHGLGGGANGGSAKNLEASLDSSKFQVVAPELPHEPYACLEAIRKYIEKYQPSYIVASSLGAFYLMCINTVIPRIVINPALMADIDIPSNFGYGIKEFRSIRSNQETTYEISEEYVKKLQDLRFALFENFKNHESYKNVYGVFTYEDEYFHHAEEYEKYINQNYSMTHGPHHATMEVFVDFVSKRIQ